MRLLQICNGLGAGNIGDEFMNRAFWDHLPSDVRLDVEIFPNARLQRDPYPPRHRYLTLDWTGQPLPQARGPGLLVGDTPVTETLSLQWPLRFLEARLDAFHREGFPIDAVGVGVEPLSSVEAREVFARSFAPLRRWTVRSASSRRALLDLGIPSDRITVGADWAWLYRPRRECRAWAATTLREAGADLGRPLVVVNVVNEIWHDRGEAKAALASALDSLSRQQGLQVVFFCNEMRAGQFYDRAAAEDLRHRMLEPAVVIPNHYYAPDEVLGLLAHSAVTISCRYHFTVQSVLAGTVPLTLARSPKMEELVSELEDEPLGTLDGLEAHVVCSRVARVLGERESLLAELATIRRSLAARALNNLPARLLGDRG